MDLDLFICPDQRSRGDLIDAQCNLCTKVALDPVQCQHSHLFCKLCILSHLQVNDTCPIQGDHLTKQQLHPNKFASTIVSRLQVSCPFRKSPNLFSSIRHHLRQYPGCHWTGPLMKLQDHKQHCSYRLITCKQCNKDAIPFNFMSTHLQMCEAGKQICSECNKLISKQQIDQHLSICPAIPIQCPNHCISNATDQSVYVTVIIRAQLESHLESCAKQQIPCKYKSVGCQVTNTREKIQLHLDKDIHQHMQLLLNRITTLETQVENCKKRDITTTKLRNEDDPSFSARKRIRTKNSRSRPTCIDPVLGK